MKKAFTIIEIVFVISMILIFEISFSTFYRLLIQFKADYITNTILYNLKKEIYCSNNFKILINNKYIIINNKKIELDDFNSSYIEREYNEKLNRSFTIIIKKDENIYYKIIINNSNSIGFVRIRVDKI